MTDFATGLVIGVARGAEWVALGYLANAVWQVPLVFAAAWVAARLARRAGPPAEHRVWVLALFLEAVLPAIQMNVKMVWYLVAALLAGPGGGHQGASAVAVGAATAEGTGGLRLPTPILAVVAISFVGLVVYLAARLVWGVWRTEILRSRAMSVVLEGDAGRVWRRCGGESRNGLARAAEIRVSGLVSGPVTVGVLRPAVLVPVGFSEGVSAEDLEAVFAHELAHVRRWDFAKNLLYEAISVAAAWHPVVWMTRTPLAESREMVCDAMAAKSVAGNESYARSLLRLAAMVADRGPAKTFHAIGIFDANSFERRVMNLTKRRVEMKLLQRLGTVAACAAMVVATCAVALALRVEVGPAVQAVAAASGGAAPLKVDEGKLTHTIYKAPSYPAEAKARKDTLDGAVVLAVTIGTDGSIEALRLKKSLREDYDRSALDAVSGWRWKPYLVDGKPVEVETMVTVTYTIQHDGEEPKTQASSSAELDSTPKIVEQVDAVYPAQARRNNDVLDGTVILNVTVGDDGKVEDTQIVSSLRADYDASAQTAVRQYRFKPAFIDGRPVKARVQLQVDFHAY